ncbi:MAG: hypothetical protein M3P98_03755 [bacterium]|nr:hypothetical protein [bacterium]
MDDQIITPNQQGGAQPVPGQPIQPQPQQPFQPAQPPQPQPMQQPIPQPQPVIDPMMAQPQQPVFDQSMYQPQPAVDPNMYQPQPMQQIQPQPMQQPIQPAQQPQMPIADPFAPDDMSQMPVTPMQTGGPKKSKKGLIIGLVAVIVIAIAGAVLYFFSGGTNSTTTPTTTIQDNAPTVEELSAVTPLGYKITIDEVLRNVETTEVTSPQEAVITKITITNDGQFATGVPQLSNMALVSGEKEYGGFTTKGTKILGVFGYDELTGSKLEPGASITAYGAFITSGETSLTFRYKQPKSTITSIGGTGSGQTFEAMNVDILLQ